MKKYAWLINIVHVRSYFTVSAEDFYLIFLCKSNWMGLFDLVIYSSNLLLSNNISKIEFCRNFGRDIFLRICNFFKLDFKNFLTKISLYKNIVINKNLSFSLFFSTFI